MLAPVLITPPAEQPVSLAEAKAHLRVTSNDDDALIGSLIKAATAKLDGYSGLLGRALVTQTWAIDLDRFGDRLRLPLRPIQSIETVKYYDAAGAQQTLAGASYALLADAIGSYVALVPDASWPSTYGRSDAVRVTFVAGYGDPEDVPEPLRLAIKVHVQMHYDPDGERLRPIFEALIDQYVVRHV